MTVRVEISGMPQISVIGTLLFVVFINDLQDNINSFVRLYANDVKLVGNAGQPDVLKHDLESFLILGSRLNYEF